MKKLLLLFLWLASLSAIGQSGSGDFKALHIGLTDSTQLVHPTGKGTLYYNSQSSKWVIYENGVRYDLKKFSSGGTAGWPLSGSATLTGNVSMTGAGYNFDMVSVGVDNITYLVMDPTSGLSSSRFGWNELATNHDVFFDATTDGARMRSNFNSVISELIINTNGDHTFTDGRASPAGLEYSADYSATYTSRSLVDKAYVDAAVGGGGGTWGSITGTLSSQTDLNTALNGKVSTTLGSGHILVGNISNVATDVAMSGDVFISSSGATSIGASKVLNSMIANSTIDVTTKLTGTLQAAQMPALTGDVTNTSGSLATTISAGSVSLSKMANLAANSIIGNNTGSPATPIALTAAQTKALLAISLSDVSGFGSGIPTWLATPSSSNLASAITDETGSGAAVFANTPTITTPVLSGLPTGSGVSSSATASTLAARDANANLSANNFVPSFTTSATAGGSTTLTVSSSKIQTRTGSTNETITLPVTSTLTQGFEFTIDNSQNTGTLTINSSGGNLVATMVGGSAAFIRCILTSGTTAASWAPPLYFPPNPMTGSGDGVIGGTNGIPLRLVNPITWVSTQFDKTSNTTLSDVTGLSYSVLSGKTYRFVAELYTASNVAGGVKFAIAGTATATNVIYEAVIIDSNVNAAQTRATALATAVGGVTAVTVALCKITGLITVNAGGTLTVQFAQNASNGTASSVLVGSSFTVSQAN